MAGQYHWEDLVDHGSQAPAPQAAPVTKPSLPAEPAKEAAIGSYMTHELRAPLTSIRSALGLLQMSSFDKLSPDERETVVLAIRNADRLDGLINDIMDFSKIQAGKMCMDLEPVAPESLLSDAIDAMRAWAVAKGVRLIRVDSDEPLPRVQADRRRTVQVIINLLSNAIKFTPAGGKVEVSAKLGGHGHAGTVQFRVKDSGPGIPAKDLERIFQSFEQSALGAKMSSGTGLGLTLARAMVELQGGKIWAESWKGLGASFLFTLPILIGTAARPIRPYRKPIEYHGLLSNVFRRLNAFVGALFA
ncbi:MAG: hypothetical protein A2X36_07245 [Elusimicrobia bacterium GWA2_69_24]|nr:MAG: hypothetical protein A2X36_07245 [Elusimicrobia bacterium GWA2_69_24]